MATRTSKIETAKAYNATMAKIDALMKKGENNLLIKRQRSLGRWHWLRGNIKKVYISLTSQKPGEAWKNKKCMPELKP